MPEPRQKALYIEAKFGPFKLQERGIPKPGPGQLLVKIAATALNPVDWKIMKYGVYVEEFPAFIGTDIAGVVEEVGEGVSEFSKGDRVFFQGLWTENRAGYQQYTLAVAEAAAKIPSQVSFEEAASIPVTITTAVAGLYLDKPYGAGYTAPLEPSARGKYAGKPLIILGGSTSIGQFVIQFAKLSGFSPIISTSSSKHWDYLKSLGATHTLDRSLSTEALAAEIAKITTAPLEIVYDSVASSATQQTGYDLLADGGQLAVSLLQSITSDGGKTIISIYGSLALPYGRELGIKLYSHLHDLLNEGAIKPLRVEVVPGGLNGVVPGLDRLQADQVSGVKLVVRPHETA